MSMSRGARVQAMDCPRHHLSPRFPCSVCPSFLAALFTHPSTTLARVSHMRCNAFSPSISPQRHTSQSLFTHTCPSHTCILSTCDAIISPLDRSLCVDECCSSIGVCRLPWHSFRVGIRHFPAPCPYPCHSLCPVSPCSALVHISCPLALGRWPWSLAALPLLSLMPPSCALLPHVP